MTLKKLPRKVVRSRARYRQRFRQIHLERHINDTILGSPALLLIWRSQFPRDLSSITLLLLWSCFDWIFHQFHHFQLMCIYLQGDFTYIFTVIDKELGVGKGGGGGKTYIFDDIISYHDCERELYIIDIVGLLFRNLFLFFSFFTELSIHHHEQLSH